MKKRTPGKKGLEISLLGLSKKTRKGSGTRGDLSNFALAAFNGCLQN